MAEDNSTGKIAAIIGSLNEDDLTLRIKELRAETRLLCSLLRIVRQKNISPSGTNTVKTMTKRLIAICGNGREREESTGRPTIRELTVEEWIILNNHAESHGQARRLAGIVKWQLKKLERGLSPEQIRKMHPSKEGTKRYAACAHALRLAEEYSRDTNRLVASNRPISVIRDKLSVRAWNVIERLGTGVFFGAGRVTTLGDLAKWRRSELLGERNCGETTVREITEQLGKHGLCLCGERPS